MRLKARQKTCFAIRYARNIRSTNVINIGPSAKSAVKENLCGAEVTNGIFSVFADVLEPRDTVLYMSPRMGNTSGIGAPEARV